MPSILPNKKPQPTVESWFEKQANENSPLLQKENTALFGFKNAVAFTDFLKSPGGKALKSSIAKKFAELQALRKSGLEAAKLEQQERAFMLFTLGLAERKEEAAERRQDIFTQQQIDKQLKQASKTKTKEDPYKESLGILADELTKETLDMDSIKEEFNDLMDTLYPKDTHDVVEKDGSVYLLPKGADLENLSSEQKNTAEKDFKQLTSNPKNTSAADQEKKMTDMIAKLVFAHQSARLLSNQLASMHQGPGLQPQPKPSPMLEANQEQHQKQHQEQHANLHKNFELFRQAACFATTNAQHDMLSKCLADDMTALNRLGGPQFLPEQFALKAGANDNTSAQVMRMQTTCSMIRTAESLSTRMAESGASSNLFLKQEASHVPQPDVPKPEDEHKSPSPFDTRPNPFKGG
ncbi:MAG: hypothetical protein QNK11_08655 [Legionella sp.]|nr:hypothetical protein [Legionella sp.]